MSRSIGLSKIGWCLDECAPEWPPEEWKTKTALDPVDYSVVLLIPFFKERRCETFIEDSGKPYPFHLLLTIYYSGVKAAFQFHALFGHSGVFFHFMLSIGGLEWRSIVWSDAWVKNQNIKKCLFIPSTPKPQAAICSRALSSVLAVLIMARNGVQQQHFDTPLLTGKLSSHELHYV